MDEHIVERLSRQLSANLDRRTLGGLAGLGAASWVMAPAETEAKKKKKKKKRKKTPTTPPTTPPPGGCRPACGAGANCVNGACVATTNLQAAIDAAAAGGTVTLPAGTSLLTSTLTIDRDLTLRGNGASQTVLDGNHAVRVLKVQAGATVTVENLTMTNGWDNADDESCGGISNLGTLSLRGVEVSNCEGDRAGGIYNNGTLHLYDTTVRGNTGSGGGGIFTGEWGTLTLHSGCVISNNSADRGGGLYSFKSATILGPGTRISGNSAEYGGGINNYESTITLQDGCVIGGDTPGEANTAEKDGGGILNQGAVELQSGSKVIGNSAARQGGGCYNDAFRASLTLKSGSRMSGNSATTGAAVWNDAGSTGIESGALVCGNTPLNDQCGRWSGTISGACPVSGRVCPA